MQATCQGETDLVVGLDSDDETIGEYPDGPGYEIRGDMQRQVVGWINALAMPRAGKYRAIGHFGDDCIPRTPGWDRRVMQALGRKPLAFGDDLERDQRPEGSLPTHVFMLSRVARKLGYFGPPAMQHMYVDFAWMAWGDAAGITYLPDVIIEHMHFLGGKAPMDDSYRLSRQLTGRDLAAMQGYAARRLRRDVAKICPRRRPYTEDDFYDLCMRRRLVVPRPPK